MGLEFLKILARRLPMGFRRGTLLKRTLATGTLLGIVGVGLFGAIHAWLIEPIWARLLGGLLFAIPAGIATTWCFVEMAKARGSRVGWRYGLFFGVVIWLALVPMTVFAAWLRVAGLRGRLDGVEEVLELAISAVTGFAVGLALGRSRRAAIAFAVGVAGLVLAMAGPIPVTNSRRALALFAAFLPLYIVTGLLLAAAFKAVLPETNTSAPRNDLSFPAILP
jgi:hypothetical protein